MALSTTPAQGMGPNYHHLHGLSQPNLLHCTETEARKLAAVDEVTKSLQECYAALVKYEADVDDVAPQHHCEMMGRARAAIAKATGE